MMMTSTLDCQIDQVYNYKKLSCIITSNATKVFTKKGEQLFNSSSNSNKTCEKHRIKKATSL